MHRIKLKENSPEYWDDGREPILRTCEHPECNESGDCRAPKDRGLNNYYHFCQEHAREYNRQWNYFDGMSEREIEDYIYNQTIWDRPTFSFTSQSDMEDYLRRQVKQDFFDEETERPKNQREYRDNIFRQSGTPEAEALAIMDLEPPVTLDSLKARYKKLVKKHHPDANGGSKESEETFKKINMAYTVLKVAYESFDKLPNRD